MFKRSLRYLRIHVTFSWYLFIYRRVIAVLSLLDGVWIMISIIGPSFLTLQSLFSAMGNCINVA